MNLPARGRLVALLGVLAATVAGCQRGQPAAGPDVSSTRPVATRPATTAPAAQLSRFEYSKIYIETGTVFLVLKDSPIKSWQDVKGKTVATVQGSSYLGLLRQKTTDFTSLSFQEYPQAILAVEQGRADTLMVEDATAVNLIKGREDKFKLVGRPRDFEAYEIGLGMRKDDPEWVNYVNGVLADLWKSGEVKRIVAPYGLTYDADFKIQ